MKAKTRAFIESMVQERERFGTFAFILIGFMVQKNASLTNHPQASIQSIERGPSCVIVLGAR